VNIRLFAAITLPDDVNDELEVFASGLPGARWSPPERRHLTLRFIGEVDGLVYQDVVAALENVQVSPFEISLRGVGHFPPRGTPRSLWAGVDESEPLRHLYRRVDRVLVEAGLEPERRKYVPHVTLARLNGTPASRVGAYLSANALYRSRAFPVEGFSLFSSQLFDHGPEYTLEATYDLPQGDEALPDLG
jgi:RNA 2',3'-cyclic 3'-phosphodiesterase